VRPSTCDSGAARAAELGREAGRAPAVLGMVTSVRAGRRAICRYLLRTANPCLKPKPQRSAGWPQGHKKTHRALAAAAAADAMAASVDVVRVCVAGVGGLQQVPLVRFLIDGVPWVVMRAWEDCGLFPASRQTFQSRLAGRQASWITASLGPCSPWGGAARSAGGARLPKRLQNPQRGVWTERAGPARRGRRGPWLGRKQKQRAQRYQATAAQRCPRGRCGPPGSAGPGLGLVQP